MNCRGPSLLRLPVCACASPPGTAGGRECGSSVIEVLLSLLLIVALAAGSGAVLFVTHATLVREDRARLALQAAGNRIEALRCTPVIQLTNALPRDFATHTLIRDGNAWLVDAARTETVSLDGHPTPIVTRAAYRDVGGGAATWDVICLHVEVVCDAGTVALDTLYDPHHR